MKSKLLLGLLVFSLLAVFGGLITPKKGLAQTKHKMKPVDVDFIFLYDYDWDHLSDPNVLRPRQLTDRVGIGTANPGYLLHVEGQAISGENSNASGLDAVIRGGYENTASNDYTTVTGGYKNQSHGLFATIGGGANNSVTNFHGVVGGGKDNYVYQYQHSTIHGGISNYSRGMQCSIGGGRNNETAGYLSTVNGGQYNRALLGQDTILGGSNNTAESASVVGGGMNNAAGQVSTIGGGLANASSGYKATILGGESNMAIGSVSFVAGQGARAYNDGVFVWEDSSDADFESTDDNQFLVYAGGGLGINTNSPQRTLHISDVLRLEPRDTAPALPAEGDLYVDSTDHRIYCYLAGVWKPLD